MYDVVFDTKAIEFLEELEKSIAKRVWNKIQASKESHARFFERLAGRQDYKLRIGDYRIIADIDNQLKRIEVTLIGHRKNVYFRKRP